MFNRNTNIRGFPNTVKKIRVVRFAKFGQLDESSRPVQQTCFTPTEYYHRLSSITFFTTSPISNTSQHAPKNFLILEQHVLCAVWSKSEKLSQSNSRISQAARRKQPTPSGNNSILALYCSYRPSKCISVCWQLF